MSAREKHRIKIGRLIHALVDRDGVFLLMCCENAYAGLSGRERRLDGWQSILREHGTDMVEREGAGSEEPSGGHVCV